MNRIPIDPSSFETPWDRMLDPDPEIEKLEVRIWELERLIRHCWIHSNYMACGYWQMDTEQKRLFEKINNTTPECFEYMLEKAKNDSPYARSNDHP